MFLPALFLEAVRKNKKWKLPTHPSFSQNLDENLKKKLLWPKQVLKFLEKNSHIISL